MEYDPSRQVYNNAGNQDLPMHQPPQFGTGNIYPPNNVPIPSAQYPQQSPGTAYYTQGSANNSGGVFVTPGYQPGSLLFTPITSTIKVFLLISGILYLLWGILDLGLQIRILYEPLWFSYFCGFWAGGVFISSGISMLVAASKTSYIKLYLLQMFIVTLVFSILGLILSIVVLFSLFKNYLDTILLVVFIISTVHTIVNILVIANSGNTMVNST